MTFEQELAGLKAITLRQPWAWMLFHGKDVENRSRNTKHRGPLLVHAGLGCTEAEYEQALDFAFGVPAELRRFGVRGSEVGFRRYIPPLEGLQRGGVVGIMWVDGTSYTELSDPAEQGWTHTWRFPAQYAWKLGGVLELPFVECSGARGFWRPPVWVLAQYRQYHGLELWFRAQRERQRQAG